MSTTNTDDVQAKSTGEREDTSLDHLAVAGAGGNPPRRGRNYPEIDLITRMTHGKKTRQIRSISAGLTKKRVQKAMSIVASFKEECGSARAVQAFLRRETKTGVGGLLLCASFGL